jgi:Ca2+-binding RTX toxin-like protein
MPTPTGSTPFFFSSLTGTKSVDSLLSGTYWMGPNWPTGGGTSLTYSFIHSGTSYFATNYSADNEYRAMYDLASSQQGGIIRALAAWSSVADITFTQTYDDANNVGDLRFGGYALMGDEAAAWAYTPSNTPKGGDVWIGDPANEFPINGSYDYMTYIHEIGHAIGLKHPFSPGALNSTILDPALDDVRYTVMSYNNNYSYQPTTPMLLDILAIQSLYGANTHWQAGDNVYSWNFYDKIFETIWDSGGTDTIDASNQLSSVVLDLNEGAFSSIGISFFDSNNNIFNSGLAIAYGSKIENAIGSSNNDQLKGNALDNVLDGGKGADTMTGGAGNDTYYVDNRGDTTIETGTSASEIDAVFSTVSYSLSDNVENITLLTVANLNASGNASNNIIIGNAGHNILDGDLGADTMIGGAGNDTYVVDNIGDVVIETSTLASEIDAVRSSINYTLGDNLENLTLTGFANINGIGNAQDNVITGNDGNNQLNGGTGLDTLIGGKGNDDYGVDQTGELALVQENANEGTDTLFIAYDATTPGETIDLSQSNLQNVENVLMLGNGAFNAIGNNLNNTLTGNAFNNTLQGGAGDDFLDGGTGADILAGGTGNDTYVIDGLEDTVIELAGEGRDTVRTSISYTLGANIEDAVLLGNAALNLNGNDANNRLTGNGGDNVIDGGLGADVMIGGGGNDTYYVDNVADAIVEYWPYAHSQVFASVDYTLSTNIETLTLTGSALNGTGNYSDNRINGTSGNNILDGKAGADVLTGFAGDDTYIVDNINDQVIELADDGHDVVRTSVSYTLGSNIEDGVLLGAAAINLTGNDQINVLTGNNGDNVLDGGAGADTLIGGAGNDTYVLDNIGDVIIETSTLATEIDTVITAFDYTLSANLENLTLTGNANLNGTGNSANNVILGNDGDNLLDGGTGTDFMAGGTGNDTYIVDNIGDVVRETSTLANEIDTVRASVNYTLSANLENLTLTGNANTSGIGNAQNNVIIGNDGNNQLNGGAGLDTLIGGKGNDDYGLDQAGELALVQENANEGVDSLFITYNATAQTSVVDLNLSNLRNVENVLVLGAGAFSVTGNSLDNTLTGNSANNVLDGGAGADTLIGGAGNDTYVVDNIGDVVSETSTLVSEIDTVRSSISYTLGANLENLTLTGNTNINATGNALGNVLLGNDGNNILDGGSGTDFMDGGEGADTYIVDNVGDVIRETGLYVGEIDTVMSSVTWTLGDWLENLTLTGSANIDAIGNTADNVLIGNDGDNQLNGGRGDDTMIGGKGNDAYAVDSWRELALIQENANEGNDSLYIVYNTTYNGDSVSLNTSNLGNIENVLLLGSGAFNVTGNSLGNTLTGNGFDNVLDGGAGADTLIGGAGNDTYVVDNIGDVVSETSTLASEIDTVLASISYTLGANVENLTLSGSTSINATGNALGNVLLGNAGNNILDGGTGTDFMAGGAGNDTYVVDNIGDVVRETSTVVGEIDTVRASISYTLGDNLENLTLTGNADLNGIGNAQNNVITGNDGNNQLNGGTGLDTLIGGKGNDDYGLDQAGELALVQENANEGTDTLFITYNASAPAETINLGLSNLQNVENVLLLGSGAFNATGNSLSNTLTGNSSDNVLDGGAGADVLIGGTGNDTYIVDNIGDVVSETSTLVSEIDMVRSSVAYILGANLENLTLTGNANINGIGNAQNNVIIGNDGDNQLNGGTGLDTLIGGKGNDDYGLDQAGELALVQENANEGVDTLYVTYNASASGETVNLGLSNLQNVENVLLLGSGAFNATGNSLGNTLTGNGFDNVLDGGAGADTLIGGAGNDTYVVDNIGDVISETSTLASEIDTVLASISYALTANVENLTLTGSANTNGTGNALGNVILGNAGDNVLDGGTGTDFMAGGAGNDTYVVDNIGDVVRETSTLAGEIDTVRASISYSLGDNLENLTLIGNADLNGIGNAQDNVIIGNDGNNQLNGGTGLDTLIGGKGNDDYGLDQAGELALVQENANEGIDTLFVTYGATAQASVVDLNRSNLQNVENVLLLGAGAFSVSGNSLDNTLTGNSFDNVLDGGTGADILIGGAGNDTYVVDNIGDVVSETSALASEIDTVRASISYTLGANLENLTLTGSANINATGNALGNVLLGNAGDNVLDGGTGTDFMAGDTGNDTYIVDNIGDVVRETSAVVGEIDTVRASISYSLGDNLENLTLTGNADLNGIGNAQDNVIIGNDGNNQLNGGTGLDTLIGGKGNDDYGLDQSGELALVQENANEGIDTLYVTYNASTPGETVDLGLSNLHNVENVLLLGAGAFNVQGNSLNNTLTGNSANNVLNGGAGADTLIGGAGADTFVFAGVNEMGTGANRDVINDFSSLQGDKIDLTNFDANLQLGGFNGFTFIGANDFTGAGQLRFVDHMLSGNVSGNVGPDFEIQLVGVNTFSANDLVA